MATDAYILQLSLLHTVACPGRPVREGNPPLRDGPRHVVLSGGVTASGSVGVHWANAPSLYYSGHFILVAGIGPCDRARWREVERFMRTVRPSLSGGRGDWPARLRVVCTSKASRNLAALRATSSGVGACVRLAPPPLLWILAVLALLWPLRGRLAADLPDSSETSTPASRTASRSLLIPDTSLPESDFGVFYVDPDGWGVLEVRRAYRLTATGLRPRRRVRGEEGATHIDDRQAT